MDKVVWRLGYAQFHRDFRHQALTSLVKERFPRSRPAYLIARVILEASAPKERGTAEANTVPMSASDIYARMCEFWDTDPQLADVPKPSWPKIVQWLGALCNDLTGMLAKVPGGNSQDGHYVMNMGAMVQYMKSKLVKCTINDRYGKESARIFELLLQKKYLEQQHVGEMAMIPAKDARERLYNMLLDRLVAMQEVPKRADRNPSTTFYLWTVRHDQVDHVHLENLYKAMLNMRLRRKFIYDREKELFLHDAAARLSDDTERERLDKVRRNLDQLDHSLLRLDKNLMHFNTF
ncbi:unnamed protein product [Discosporangium mesarthrocarpum]